MSMSMSMSEGVITLVGLTALTLLTRGFFFLSQREVPFPPWLRQGLRYAPLAALVAVIAPEMVMSQGRLIATWMDARLPAVALATAYFYWRRDILGTIVSGTVVFLAFKLGLGW